MYKVFEEYTYKIFVLKGVQKKIDIIRNSNLECVLDRT